MDATRSRGTLVTVTVTVLLLAGCLEAVASVLALASEGAGSVPSHGGPAALLPVTIAVLLATLGGRGARIGALFGAVPALVVRLVFVTSLVVPGRSFTVADILTVGSGAVTGLALAGFALHLVVRHHDLADAPLAESVPRPLPSPAQTAPAVQRRLPESPSTPVNLTLKAAPAAGPGAWATSSTPWPRAVEEDPDGTLIRPPRR